MSSTLVSQSEAPSVVGSISDLDGYTLRDFSFGSLPEEDFGFDPPQLKPTPLNNFQVYSPPNDLTMSDWPEFGREDESKPFADPSMLNPDAYEIDKYINTNVPTGTGALSRYGQMTPPRSNSAASTDSASDGKLSPKSTVPERRKRTKTASKDLDPATSTSTAAPASTATTADGTSSSSTTVGRKRKASRKASTSVSEEGDSAEDQKRRQSLEKNRLAAAKCRINKKEKTEKLQRDSHEKAVQNAYLKDQVMRMKDEIQQMNSILLAHASCEGCKAPEEIHAHLSSLENDFFNQHLTMSGQTFGDYPSLAFSDLPVIPDNFMSGTSQDQLLNPPLPDFERSAEFDVTTPLQIPVQAD
ncbi:hypothetical protein A1O1_02568 [Capronia coronata CBS 617.96]|uniref:BZIP domain-containing protein n=1 Tax=Capronia coronata CBS 617.96 TaxID=1182541 RepID=W9YWV8_9EURO|nr:uncharacterized protein A1O1_02568 [Capronia coronata CBS 617.96]EXJ94175.1 hypothetical protein A1O1_02568 [Capronia coronata CBS 617.96]